MDIKDFYDKYGEQEYNKQIRELHNGENVEDNADEFDVFAASPNLRRTLQEKKAKAQQALQVPK